uniref:FerB domain-containing protein n=1 Tax=Angiostrongylus cantonensis TaxID=6313 RepID=A0A158P8K5_ANGCA
MQKIKSKVGKKLLKNATASIIPEPQGVEEEPLVQQVTSTFFVVVADDEKSCNLPSLTQPTPVTSDTDTVAEAKGKNSSTGTETDDTKDEDKSDSDEDLASKANLHYGKADKNFGATTFVDADKRTTWHVLLRIIEGRDLKTGALRVRASLNGLQKCTRVSSQGNPVWKQNLVFLLKDISLQKLASDTLAIKVTRAKRFSEKVTGEFMCQMGSVIHSPGRVVVSKWIALRVPTDEEDDDGVYENCGFLKVSINVYSITESPARMNDDLDSEEIWSGAQLEEMSLRVRLFRLHQLAGEIHEEVAKCTARNTEKPLKFVIRASISMRSIYEPGQEGFLPTFGPSFLNFFGLEKLKRLKWFKEHEKDMIKEDDGSKYLARLLVSVDCTDYVYESVQRTFIDHSSLLHSRNFEKVHRYNVYCSFFACNLINPLFASDEITFMVSMGEYGSTGTNASHNRSSVLGVLPDHDDTKYFSMPWGNHKPMADVPGLWEDVDARMERSNAIKKVAIMLDELLKVARRLGDSKNDQVASLAMEALEHMQCMLDRLHEHHRTDFFTTELDSCSQRARKMAIEKILKEIGGFKFDESQRFDEMGEKIVRFLLRMKENVLKLSTDCQISLPDIIIKMLATNKVVGYIKVPARKIFFSENEALSGEWCGQMQALTMAWPTAADRKSRQENFPAVVHARMWFGKRGSEWSWKEAIMPAEIKTYLEIFSYQNIAFVAGFPQRLLYYCDEDEYSVLAERQAELDLEGIDTVSERKRY